MKKQAVILLLLAAVMAALSIGVWAAVRGRIADNQQAVLQEAMAQVLPDAQGFVREEYDDLEELIRGVWKADKGYAIEAVAYGYHDNIHLMVGVGNDGAVRGVRVLAMNETPGLGAQAGHDAAFLAQFIGTRSNAALGEGIDALSGATVTTKAFIKAVNAASAYVTGADVSSGATQWGG